MNIETYNELLSTLESIRASLELALDELDNIEVEISHAKTVLELKTDPKK